VIPFYQIKINRCKYKTNRI